MENKDMTQQDKNFFIDYFDEKFKHLKELMIEKITGNEKEIKENAHSIRELETRTSKNTTDIEIIKERISGIKEISKEVKTTEKEAEDAVQKDKDRRLRFKFLLYGIPIAVIIFMMQLGIQAIIKILFP